MLDRRSNKMRSMLALLAVSVALPVSAQTEGQEEFDAEAYFKEGMQSREEGKPYSAIKSFQTILSNQPSLQRARLELAVAYLQTLQFEQAQAEAQQVLDDPNTPDNVKIAILAFLAQVKKDADSLLPGHTTKATITAGVMHDSNVNVGPTSDVININGNTLQLDPSSEPIEDGAFVLSASFDHSYRTDKKIRIGEDTGLLLWQSGASFYDRAYYGNEEFDLRVIGVRTGPALISNAGFRASAPLVVDYIRLGDDDLATYYGVQPTATWTLENSAELTLNGEYTQRDFVDSANEDRDSQYMAVGVSLGKGYQNNTIAVQGGIEFSHNNAKIDRYSYDSFETFVGANWEFKPKAVTYAKVSRQYSSYDGVEPVFDEARSENELELQLGLL